MRNVFSGGIGVGAVVVLAVAATAAGGEVGYCTQPALHGERLIFVSEGDLWTATIPGAEPTAPILAYRLTASAGNEMRPSISPDGRFVAFSAEFDGNTDVYVMPVEGGSPRRLTFHPSVDLVLGWAPNGQSVLFRSDRAHPLSRPELWRVNVSGGMESRYDLGECTLAALSSTGKRIAFTPWSNETWNWKRYRGGTTPDIWLGDLDAGTYRPLTTDPANDLFPMWVSGRVYFISDRSGSPNFFSDSPEGGDLKQHTRFAANDAEPTAIEGYDVRWPSGDARRGGTRIVFVQGAALALFDTNGDTVVRLDVQLASDRAAARGRFTPLSETVSDFNLSVDGKNILVGTRGEILAISVEDNMTRQLTRTSGAREWGAAYLDKDRVVLITDVSGEQQVGLVAADGTSGVDLITQDREDWLFRPVASPNGQFIAFGDKTLRLHLLDMSTLARRQIDSSEAFEITDYRFSPDSNWVAYVKPQTNGYNTIHLYSIRTGRSFQASDGMHNDTEPRWDPAGRYLYFLSKRRLNPVLSELDFEHAIINSTQIFALPLTADTPPPVKSFARSVKFDLEAWAKPAEKEGKVAGKPPVDGRGDAVEPGDAPAGEAPPQGAAPMRVDTDNLASRAFLLPIDAGNLRNLEAAWGSVVFISASTRGLLDDVWPAPPLGIPDGTVHHFDLVEEKLSTLSEKTSRFVISGDGSTIALPRGKDLVVMPVSGGSEELVEFKADQLRIDQRAEWKQMFHEAWRLQRDFFWAPNFVGVNWSAMRTKYEALLPRVGTRRELNELIGEMIGELGTSHTYVWGGEETNRAKPVAVGLLGADIVFDGAFRIARIIPGHPWDEEMISPLALPFLGVKPGNVILAINNVRLTPSSNVYDLLQDQADKPIALMLADDAGGANTRTIEVTPIDSEKAIRYADWVESNRQIVEKASDGQLGYLHLPDMDNDGIVAFNRSFYPQINKKGLVIDIRDNGGGFVSQMLIQRFARKAWAFSKPRHGAFERYPQRSLYGHLAVIIDQHAGSDGDIFPESFRLNGLGPLIGTRTWGGVVGIRADKPFVDGGVSTQPEFAWWEPKRGWNLENEGVSPDIEVALTPADRAAGRDPQLERTISVLLEKLKEDPKELPSLPAWPNRAR